MSEARILIVDDNEVELAVLRVVLEAEGFEVETLDTVFDLSITIKRDPPDLILLDIMMPALTGDRAATILKQHGFSRDIPVVLHSSKEDSELAAIATRTGAQGFVHKAGDFNKLLSELRRVLAKRRDS